MGKKSTNIRILVVDDEENIAYLLTAAMRNQGFDVESCDSGEKAISLARTFNPDVIILDVLLPDKSGIEVVKAIRSVGVTAPVIFLSALGSATDKVAGLTSGGDDYMVKPFALEELIARVDVQLRRTGYSERRSILELDTLVIDVDARRVWRNNMESHLSSTEFNLLHFLMSHPGKVVTRAQILDHVWHYDFEGDSTIIETVMSNVRRKIDNGTPRLIRTVRGVGYCIRVPE
ncbi:MAG: response regulator transcription factor [Ilumatobacteraceae bacterium]